MKRLAYQGRQDGYQIEAGGCKMIAMADIGPRIVHLSQRNCWDLFKLFERQMGKTGEDEWRLNGEHGVWYATENLVESYIPDNDPVELESLTPDEICFRVVLKPEGEKSHTMRVAIKGCGFKVVNRVKNLSEKLFRTASYGLTILASGGVGFMSISEVTSLADTFCASRCLNIWDYTSFSDPAYDWNADWIEFHQERALARQKVRTYLRNTWLAFRLGDSLVIKTFEFHRDDVSANNLPDLGSNVEVYFYLYMLELEGLYPWTDLKPGGAVFHAERLQVHAIKPGWSNAKVIELARNSITFG